MTVREATPAEVQEVTSFFESMESGLSQEVLGDRDLFIVERGDYTAVTLGSPDLTGLPAGILEEADHCGLRIGTMEDGEFAMDLQGALRMAQHSHKQAIRVTEKASRLFLYGRNILGSSVRSFDPRLNNGDVCIVCNPRWEALGLGVVTGRFKGDTEAVKPVHDLGAYLRDQS